MQENSAYIIQCRTNWFLGIRPCDKTAKDREEYKALIKIAQSYFDKDRYQEFSDYFMEGHYLIPLWTAHLILEYGQPTHQLKEKCLQIITEYTNNPLAPDVAIQEKEWLENFNNSK